jgi:hypothetical protein
MAGAKVCLATTGSCTGAHDDAQESHRGHSSEPTSGPGVTCELTEDIDEKCVNAAILKCEDLGAWSAWNQCQSYAADVINK